MHSQLLHDGAPILMASDTPPGGGSLKPGNNNFSVSVHCDSLDEIERLFSALGQNGKVRMPLGDMPWGSRLGMLTDQFGIQWLFNYDLPR
jgi:PhnB protein